MYNALGYGIGDTILACFAILVGIPSYVSTFRSVLAVRVVFAHLVNGCSPFLFWKYGERIRNASRYATGSIPKSQAPPQHGSTH